MLAWYDDIKNLTEKSGEERNAFVRRHASVRSASAGSARSASSDGGLDEDEADAVPFSANQSLVNQPVPVREQSSRPSPGGRFPSDLNVNRNLQAPLSPSSGSSDFGHDLTTASGGPQQDIRPMYLSGVATDNHTAAPVQPVQHQQEFPASSYVNSYPPTQQPYQGTGSYTDKSAPWPQSYQAQTPLENTYTSAPQQYQPQPSYPNHSSTERHDSTYGGWLAPAAGGTAAGALGGHLASEAHHRKQVEEQERAQQEEINNQAQLDNHDRSYFPQPVSTSTAGVAPAVPERDPDHHAPAAIDQYINSSEPGIHPTLIPAPVLAAGAKREPTNSHLDGATSRPSTADTSFLDDSEVGAPTFGTTSGKTINGGPVPVDLVNLADAQAHPGMHRTNTDISVSDLHVPGEYPKAPKVAAPKLSPTLKEEDVIQM